MAHAAFVLCPVDFSPASRGALRYGIVVAEHFGATLTVVAVRDPLLTEVADIKMGPRWLPDKLEHELQGFVNESLAGRTKAVQIESVVVTGKPAEEILALARERKADLIVMSSHGLTGTRKLFFGAPTERVLRETT